MAAFSYKALDEKGKVLSGIIDGDSERQVRNQLRSRNLKPIEVQEAGAEQEHSLVRQLFSPRISQSDLALFTRQIATLVKSDVPLDEALAATATQSRKTRVKSLVLQIRNSVVAGHSLGTSLSEFPRSFNDMYCAMVRAGESAGFLGQVLEQLSDYIENRQFAQQKLKMALVYPLALMAVAVIVISLLMIFVMPELVSLFAHTSAELPPLTRVLIGLSEFMVVYWWLVLVVMIVLIAGVGHLMRMPAVKTGCDRLFLQIPFIATFIKTVETERFTSTLAILVSSGVPLLEGLRIASAVVSNSHLKQACLKMAGAVQEGESLYKAMEREAVFSPMLVQMVASGESSGNLETMLMRSAKNQGRELEALLNTLLGIMEPAIIVVMASVVGAIVMAVLLPIMQMNTLVA